MYTPSKHLVEYFTQGEDARIGSAQYNAMLYAVKVIAREAALPEGLTTAEKFMVVRSIVKRASP